MHGEILKKVVTLEPGYYVEIDRYDLAMEFSGYCHNSTYFTPADRLMENIVGSAYEFSYQVNYSNGNIIFHRLIKPLKELRSYISPDRR